MPCSASEAFDWHARGGAFAPCPSLGSPGNPFEVGNRSRRKFNFDCLRKLGFRKEWVALISERLRESTSGCSIKRPLRQMGAQARVQRSGCFNECPNRRNKVRIARGSLVNCLLGHVQSILERTFWYRHEITRSDLDLWDRYRDRSRLKILISGGYGFLGSRLALFLRTQGLAWPLLPVPRRNDELGSGFRNGS